MTQKRTSGPSRRGWKRDAIRDPLMMSGSSWPSSPLAASRQVSARLYSSLQHSRQQEDNGHGSQLRQVSFSLSSPDLSALRMSEAAPPLLSEKLERGCLDPTSHHAISSGVESEAEEAELTIEKSMSNESEVSGKKHMQEMESVRRHLQSILRSSHPSERHGLTNHLVAGSQLLLDDSQESEATSYLLRDAADLFPRYARLRSDSNCAASELHLLREALERERERRKESEAQVCSLLSRLLHLQQQLTLAVAADRKKDAMIEQLDKTLVKVVEGWKAHDQDRNEELKQLQKKEKEAESMIKQHTQDLEAVQGSLSQAQAALEQEQSLSQQLQSGNTRLEQEASDLRVCLEDLKQEELKLRRDAQKLREELHTLQMESNKTTTQLQQDKEELRKHTLELQEQLSKQTLECAREETERKVQKELETVKRERDRVREERELEQSRWEAQKAQMEVQFALSLEQQMSERLQAVHEENASYSTQLRQQHRKQLLDLSARHERELAAQLEQSRSERQGREEKLRILSVRLAELQDQLGVMAAAKRKLETQREELVSSLQGMMRSHWAETLRLLTNQEQVEGVRGGFCSSHLSAPQAVVLHLSREKEREKLRNTGARSHTYRLSESVEDSSSSSVFRFSDCSALWVRPEFSEQEALKGETLSHPHSHTPANNNTGGLVGGQSHSELSENAPPLSEEVIPSKIRDSTSISEDRQNELQYYVSKLLDRSPGEPLDQPIRKQHSCTSTNTAERLLTQSSSNPEPKQEKPLHHREGPPINQYREGVQPIRDEEFRESGGDEEHQR
ncbi:hypothetical protein DNTS_017535 [Danionella cerebrum]|uniref:Uncharacterized protein n=1 Tax=Danionella cerebrum TaxID=2873325 RepID=A0A553QK38_9TELE|nr:hypothetical protein DNTS_017535 [Danionella translucida]